MIIDKKVLNITETAYLLGISSFSVYNLIRSGKIIAYKDENNYAWHIPEAALQAYMESRLTQANLTSTSNTK